MVTIKNFYYIFFRNTKQRSLLIDNHNGVSGSGKKTPGIEALSLDPSFSIFNSIILSFPENFFNFVVENKLDKPWLKDINSLDSFSATSSDLRWVELSCLSHFTDFYQIPLPSKIKKLISLARQLANIEIDNILIDNIDSLRILRNEEDIMRIVSLGLECMDQKLITKIVHLYKDIKFAELEKLDPNERKNEKINLLKDLVSKL